ncbi:MAG: helix-turn-helix domain-containing protein [Stenotrophobium sp.]
MHLFIWNRRFLLHADPYVMDRRSQPYRRLSITLIVAHTGSFALAVNGGPVEHHEAAIVASNVQRDFIEAPAGGISIFDAGISTETFLRLAPRVAPGRVQALTAGAAARLRELLARQAPAQADLALARALYDAAIDIACETPAAPLQRDPRILQLMATIERLPLDAQPQQQLTQSAGLSESRLRALFRQHLGCSMSQYLRWVTAWKAVALWRRGVSLTQIAHDAGFYDLSHADRVAREITGMNPSAMIDPRKVRLLIGDDFGDG